MVGTHTLLAFWLHWLLGWSSAFRSIRSFAFGHKFLLLSFLCGFGRLTKRLRSWRSFTAGLPHALTRTSFNPGLLSTDALVKTNFCHAYPPNSVVRPMFGSSRTPDGLVISVERRPRAWTRARRRERPPSPDPSTEPSLTGAGVGSVPIGAGGGEGGLGSGVMHISAPQQTFTAATAQDAVGSWRCHICAA